MAKYVRKSPMVDAIQWDGTQQGSLEIMSLILASHRNTTVDVKYKVKRGKIVRAFITVSGLFDGKLDPTEWLVVEPSGMYIVSDRDFQKEFERAATVVPVGA